MNISKYLVTGAGLILLGAGCFGSSDSSIDRKFDGTTTFTDNETGAQINVGTGASIPANFPSEVPVYQNGEIQTAAVSTVEGQTGATLMITTDDSAETVRTWYEAQLTSTGWSNQASYNTGGTTYNMYEKAEAIISVSVSPADDSAETTVLIVWAPNNN